MRVKYEHGGPHDPVKDILSNQVQMLPTAEVVGDFVPRDEDEAKIYRNLGVQGVMDLREMKGAVREGRDQFARDYMYPALEAAMALETGKGIIDLGRLGAKGISALLKNPRVMAKLMGRSPDEVLEEAGGMKLIKTSDKAAKKIADEGAKGVQATRNRIQSARLQTEANRLLRQASKDESQAILNLQASLDDALSKGVIEEAQAVKAFQEAVDNVFTQARVDSRVLGNTDQLARQLGPTMEELYKTNRPLFNSVYNDLIGPVTSRKISGAVNPRMNKYGGIVPKSKS